MKRDDEAIEEEAAQWADRQRRQEMGEAANAELRAWLAGGSERSALFRAHAEMLADPAPVPPRAPAPGWRRAASWSAGVAVVALAVGVLIWPTQQVAVSQTFAAAAGRPFSATLTDGSSVQLNGGSDIHATFDGKTRVVRLRGEGFFAVAKDADRPFSVLTQTHRVTALGTRFNVDERSDGAVEISVLEGRIEVVDLQAPEHRVVMTAGHRLVAGKTPLSTALVRSLDSEVDTPDWTQGWIDADDMSLADLLLELRRQSPDLQVGLADTALAGRRISGRFKTSDPRAVLTVVAATQGLTVRTEASGRVLLDR